MIPFVFLYLIFLFVLCSIKNTPKFTNKNNIQEIKEVKSTSIKNKTTFQDTYTEVNCIIPEDRFIDRNHVYLVDAM